MKYLIKTIELETWTHWYTVEADSGDEAMERFKKGDWLHIVDFEEEYEETTDREIVDIEPYGEDIHT